MNIYIKSLAFAFILVGMNACNSNEVTPLELQEVDNSVNDNIEITTKQFESSGFKTSQLSNHSFNSKISVTGTIHLPNKYEQIVSSNVGGIIDGLKFISGQWVKKGQVLFTISATDIISLQQSYLELKSQENYMVEEAARQKLLAEEKISAKKNYIKAKADLEFLQAQVSGTSKKLELYGITPSSLTIENLLTQLQIRAKKSGYISKINIKNGGYLKPGESAMEIASIYGMHLELLVLAKDINPLEVGQTVLFSVSSIPSNQFNSKIALIEKEVDHEGYVSVHCEISTDDKKILTPGMFVNADVILQSVDLPALPSESFVTIDGKTYVLVQSPDNQNSYQKLEVSIEKSENGFSSFSSKMDILQNSVFLSKGSYYLITED